VWTFLEKLRLHLLITNCDVERCEFAMLLIRRNIKSKTHIRDLCKVECKLNFLKKEFFQALFTLNKFNLIRSSTACDLKTKMRFLELKTFLLLILSILFFASYFLFCYLLCAFLVEKEWETFVERWKSVERTKAPNKSENFKEMEDSTGSINWMLSSLQHAPVSNKN
jgi:hypothetical protein